MGEGEPRLPADERVVLASLGAPLGVADDRPAAAELDEVARRHLARVSALLEGRDVLRAELGGLAQLGAERVERREGRADHGARAAPRRGLEEGLREGPRLGDRLVGLPVRDDERDEDRPAPLRGRGLALLAEQVLCERSEERALGDGDAALHVLGRDEALHARDSTARARLR